MMYVRYRMASQLAPGGTVLEVGCGSGMGLPYLREHAKLAVGGDYTMALLQEARGHVSAAPLLRMDGQHLPFLAHTFDVVLMLEMVYYLPDLEAALVECRRVLKPGGRLMISVPNPNRPDFNPSPFSSHYPNAAELASMLTQAGFRAAVYGGFPVEPATPRDELLARLRHVAVRYHLIPRSMRAKSMVKRLMYGRLPKLGAVHDGIAAYAEPVRLDGAAGDTAAYKTLYAVGVSS
jgi:SAM-dependent methyltransferase